MVIGTQFSDSFSGIHIPNLTFMSCVAILRELESVHWVPRVFKALAPILTMATPILTALIRPTYVRLG